MREGPAGGAAPALGAAAPPSVAGAAGATAACWSVEGSTGGVAGAGSVASVLVVGFAGSTGWVLVVASVLWVFVVSDAGGAGGWETLATVSPGPTGDGTLVGMVSGCAGGVSPPDVAAALPSVAGAAPCDCVGVLFGSSVVCVSVGCGGSVGSTGAGVASVIPLGSAGGVDCGTSATCGTLPPDGGRSTTAPPLEPE